MGDYARQFGVNGNRYDPYDQGLTFSNIREENDYFKSVIISQLWHPLAERPNPDKLKKKKKKIEHIKRKGIFLGQQLKKKQTNFTARDKRKHRSRLVQYNVLLYLLCNDRSMKFYKEETPFWKGNGCYPCKRKILGKIQSRGEGTSAWMSASNRYQPSLLRRSIPFRVMPRSFRFYPPHPCPLTRTRRGRIRLLTAPSPLFPERREGEKGGGHCRPFSHRVER